MSETPELYKNLEYVANFLKTRENVIIIAYKVPTEHVAKEDVVRKYRSEMINALQRTGLRKGVTAPLSAIHIDALPAGDFTYIKGWFRLIDAQGKPAEKERERAKEEDIEWLN